MGCWQARVYSPSQTNMSEDYVALKRSFCRQFNYCCQACRKRFSADCLSLHHIVPREEGGADEGDNLILLCHSCHDKVELDPRKYGSHGEIAYSFCARKPPKPKWDRKEIGANWQSWVYGGRRNPMKDAK